MSDYGDDGGFDYSGFGTVDRGNDDGNDPYAPVYGLRTSDFTPNGTMPIAPLRPDPAGSTNIGTDLITGLGTAASSLINGLAGSRGTVAPNSPQPDLGAGLTGIIGTPNSTQRYAIYAGLAILLFVVLS